MAFRTVIISTHSKIEYSLDYLVYRTTDTEKRIHLDEVSTVIFETTNISITTRLLVELIKRKINVIFCDVEHNQSAQLYPLYGAHNSLSKITEQLNWDNKIKGDVWKEIVKHKIYGQRAVLSKYGRVKESTSLLDEYINDVDIDDISNREGHAAKVYFNSLFNEKFTRSDDSKINMVLNYGYSLILSLFNRAIVTSGYLTQIGIHHKNEFNHFNFSCDLMEPYRPFIDKIACECYLSKKFSKEDVLSIFQSEIFIDNSHQNLVNSINIYANSIFNALNFKDIRKIKFPSYNDL